MAVFHTLNKLIAPFLIGILFFSLHAEATQFQPQEPKLTITSPTNSADSNSILLTWNAPDNIQNIKEYQIFKDGRFIATAEESNQKNSASYPYFQHFFHQDKDHFAQKVIWQSAKVTALKPNVRYQFFVRVVSSDNKILATSNTLSLQTASVPKVINVTQFGAIGDGVKDNTDMLQKAIDDCSSGCEVMVPAGIYMTGALFLHSNMTLNLEKGAVLKAINNPALYPIVNHRPVALINVETSSITPAKTFSNIRIIGQGSLDGNGWQTWNTFLNDAQKEEAHYDHGSNKLYSQYGVLAKSQVHLGMQSGLSEKTAYSQSRSNLLFFKDVKGLYIQGISLKNPSYHVIVSSHSQNITLNGVSIESYDVNNGDGIDISDSRDVSVLNSYFDVGDDAVNFAAGAGQGSEQKQGVNHAHIFNNYIAHAHGGIVLGSMTGSWIKNVIAENNIMQGTMVGLRAKSNDAIGGGADHILFRNTALKALGRDAIEITLQYGDPNATQHITPAATPAQFQNISVSHVSVDGITGKLPAILMLGDTHHRAYNHDIHFNDVKLRSVYPTDIQDLRDSSFNKVTATDVKGHPFWSFKHIANVTIDGQQVLDSRNK